MFRIRPIVSSHSSGSISRPHRRTARPRIELLEARALLAAPSGLEQELLEWVNRFRIDPAGEFDRFVSSLTPVASPIPDVANALTFFQVDLPRLRTELGQLSAVPPLAWNSALHDAALGHNQLMIAADQQSHQLPGEPSLSQRITNAGYTSWSAVAENVFAFARGIAYAHAGFVIDWGDGPGGMQDPRGHRNTLISNAYREIGIAVTPESNPSTSVGPLVVTQNFGARFTQTQPFLLGVVYNDANGDSFYANGEGLGGVVINVVGAAGSFQTTTTASGGYQLNVPPGAYTVTFSGAGLSSPTQRFVNVGTANTKLDLNTRDATATHVVQMEASLIGVTEGAEVEIALHRSGDLSVPLVVTVNLVPGGTGDTSDVVPLESREVRFEAGQSRQTIRIRTFDDDLREPTETVVIGIDTAPGYALGFPNRTTIQILDNDSPVAAPPSVESARVLTTARGMTAIAVRFSGDIDPRLAAQRTAYQIRRAGRDRRLLTRDDARLAPTRVTYNTITREAILWLANPLRNGETLQLNFRANLLRSTGGAILVGPTSHLLTASRTRHTT